MGVSIIRGAIGSGKSNMCLDDMEKVHNGNPSARCIMIVPDHYSYEAEKSAARRFGGTGLNNIEVLTLRRMALGMLSVTELNHLTDAGKQMLIYKAVTKTCEKLTEAGNMNKLVTAMRRRGFLDIAASLISEMKRYMITPAMLSERAGDIEDNETLKNKLTALSMFYGNYTEYVYASDCSDSDDDLIRLAEHIRAGAEYDENTYVWVNRFDKLLPQQKGVLEALLEKGVHMTISVCCASEDNAAEREIYRETEKTLEEIYSLAGIYGFEGERQAGKGLSHIKDKPDLYALLSRWTEDFVYEDIPKHMSLFQSRDTYGEIERIACKITDLVRDEGYRYRDIALVCGDESEYSHLTEAVFGEYNIPYFSDRKISLSDHPIAMQILSLFDLIEEDWSYESVFRYLRAGFIYRRGEYENEKKKYIFYTPIDQDEIDKLENYVLKNGIRGAKRWLAEEAWTGDNDILTAAFNDEAKEGDERIDALRREISAPPARFWEAVKGKRSAKELASALFGYLTDIKLYAGLKSEISAFRKKGMLNEAEQFTKIWNLILDVLNQTTTALGDEKMTAGEFAEYMSVGLSKCEIRTIPSGIDQVYVGSAERISHTRVKIMFIAGARNGTFPLGIKTEGFLSNKDRNTMKESLNITIAPDTKKKTEEQYYKIYRAMCTAEDRIYFSYSIQDEEGKTQSPSHMLLDIYRKFPKMRVSDNLVTDSERDRVYISSPKATLHRLLINLSSRYDGKKNPLWDIVYEWYEDKEEWQRVLSLMRRADFYSRRGVMLDSDIANMLYEGKITYNASRINTFARCPFEYFLKYGLGAREREEWDITPANMGSYAHRIINDFCAEVEKNAKDSAEKLEAWRTLDDEKRDGLINDIIDQTCDNLMASGVRDKERTAGIFRRMGRTVSRAAKLVQKSLSAGSFTESGMEQSFTVDIAPGIAMSGLVDRLDTCVGRDGKTYLRIIDYKTGKTSFDVVNIANGYDMQMVIYALAEKELMQKDGTDAQVAGIYYTGVRDDYKKITAKSVTEANIKQKNAESLILDGVTFVSEDEEQRRSMLSDMDNGFFENYSSVFTNVSMEADGSLKNVKTLDEINGLMEYVRETIGDMDSRARNGEISLNPYKSNSSRYSVCEYCSYGSVCKFDEEQKKIREPQGGKDEIWERMKVKGAAMRGGEKNGEMD